MDDTAQAAQTIARFLQSFTTSSGLRLRFRVKARSLKQRNADSAERRIRRPAEGVAKEAPRALFVEFTGPDTPVLTARNGELLNALEHIATKMLRLEPEEHDRVAFDADQFKANRDRQMRESAAAAIERVRATGRAPCLSPDDLARAPHDCTCCSANPACPPPPAAKGRGVLSCSTPKAPTPPRPSISPLQANRSLPRAATTPTRCATPSAPDSDSTQADAAHFVSEDAL